MSEWWTAWTTFWRRTVDRWRPGHDWVAPSNLVTRQVFAGPIVLPFAVVPHVSRPDLAVAPVVAEAWAVEPAVGVVARPAVAPESAAAPAVEEAREPRRAAERAA